MLESRSKNDNTWHSLLLTRNDMPCLKPGFAVYLTIDA